MKDEVMVLSDAVRAAIDSERERFPEGRARSVLIFALTRVQDELGWLSPAALQAVADYLFLPLVAVHEVAHFYSMFCTRPVGRHTIRVCTSMPCEMAGGNVALRYLQEKLGIAVGETTKDGQFTLFAGTCMGSCGEGPVLLVNNKRMCVRMSNDRIDALLEELQS